MRDLTNSAGVEGCSQGTPDCIDVVKNNGVEG